MSAARSKFCQRLSSIRTAMVDFALHDFPATPQNLARNESARIIRNGLVVQCFNTFEDFLRERIAEILNLIESSNLAFLHLPNDLRKAATLESLKAIIFQLKLQDAASRIGFVQDHCEKIGSTKNAPFSLSEFSFFHANSNVTKDDLRSALSAFMIDKPWDQIRNLCSRLGLSAMAAETVFLNFSQRRHNAAHRANTSTSEVDLTQSLLDATGLSLGFDVLVTKAANYICNSQVGLNTNQFILIGSSIPIRSIKFKSGKFMEIKEGASRSAKSDVRASTLIPRALQRAQNENGVLVVYDELGRVVEWMT
jgi:hypothetical protein